MSNQGRYFIIVGDRTQKVISVSGTDPIAAGTLALLAAKDGSKGQQWFFDPVKSNTICSRANRNLCLTLNANNRLIVDVYRAGDNTQTWVWNSARKTIDRKTDTNSVIDDMGVNNATFQIYTYPYVVDNQCQKWTLEMQPKVYFYIRSKLDGKVMELNDNNTTSGTAIVVNDKNPANTYTQLWLEDNNGNLRSMLNQSVVLDATDTYLRLGFDNVGQTRTYWSIQGDEIVNVFNTEEVLQARDCSTSKYVVVKKRTEQNIQKWAFDEWSFVSL